ncbi:MAG: GntR family transcriptional regulator [Acidobacteria bacterium]|nr:GntR family transcriptional regulator [Acidobacteriota bacterium]
MLPFTVTLRPGLSVHEQVVFAVKRAIVSGRLKPGDEFPSVRTLSRELRINPNTAHKVVATLVGDTMLDVRPGIGTFVAERGASSSEERRLLLREDVERLAVDARHLGLDVQDVVDAVIEHWNRLNRPAR